MHQQLLRAHAGPRPLAAAVVAALFLAVVTSCDGVEPRPCAEPADRPPQTPSEATVAPGDSFTVRVSGISGRAFCDGPATRRNVVTWESSNPSVASVAPIDSLSARVTAVATGQAVIVSAAVDNPRWGGATRVIVVP